MTRVRAALSRSCRAPAAAVCVAALAASPLRGQRPRPIALDFTLGAGAGWGGGEWLTRGGVAADAVLAGALRSTPSRATVVGASAAFQGPLGVGDVCTIDSRGQCLRAFPTFLSLALLGGWERRTGADSTAAAPVRVLVGPAVMQADGDVAAGERGRAAAALQARLDLASSFGDATSFVLSLRGTAIPRWQGKTLGLLAAGLGVRLR